MKMSIIAGKQQEQIRAAANTSRARSLSRASSHFAKANTFVQQQKKNPAGESSRLSRLKELKERLNSSSRVSRLAQMQAKADSIPSVQRVQYLWMIEPDTPRGIEDYERYLARRQERQQEEPPEYLYRFDTRRPMKIISDGGFQGRESSQLSGSTVSNQDLDEKEMAFSAASFTQGDDSQIKSELRMAASAMDGYLYRFKKPLLERISNKEALRGWQEGRFGTEGAEEQNVKGKVSSDDIEVYVSQTNKWVRLGSDVKTFTTNYVKAIKQ